jgi:hypothetical protein
VEEPHRHGTPQAADDPSRAPAGAGRVVDRWLKPLLIFVLDNTWKALWICIWYCLFAPFFDHMRH